MSEAEEANCSHTMLLTKGRNKVLLLLTPQGKDLLKVLEAFEMLFWFYIIVQIECFIMSERLSAESRVTLDEASCHPRLFSVPTNLRFQIVQRDLSEEVKSLVLRMATHFPLPVAEFQILFRILFCKIDSIDASKK